MLNSQHSFLDIETTLVSWLSEVLCIPTYLGVPDEAPERFITVERIGGATTNIVVDRPIVAIQAWALTRMDAGLLANNIASVVALMPREIPRITKATVSSHHHLPLEEEEESLFRYQVVIDLVTR
jgi:hypothetical protein